MESPIKFVLDNIDFKEKYLLEVIFYSFLSIIVWGLLPHLQYRYKLISTITQGDMEKGADILALVLIHIGTFRNYSFTEAIYNNKRLDFGNYNIISTVLGIFIIFLGSYLWVTSLLKLGVRGCYFGDHFGFLLKKKNNYFPF